MKLHVQRVIATKVGLGCPKLCIFNRVGKEHKKEGAIDRQRRSAFEMGRRHKALEPLVRE